MNASPRSARGPPTVTVPADAKKPMILTGAPHVLTVTVAGKTESLPKKEFLLLFKLLSYPGRIFTRRQLMDEIWDLDSESDERTVDVHINRLRDRFRGNADFEIQTVRGLGYKAVLRA